MLEEAVSDKTRAIMIAHTLGNPFDLGEVMRIAKKYKLWVVEDCCDALGATYDGKLVGTFGDIGTLSFYPAHHITMGEGGAVFTDKIFLRRIIESDARLGPRLLVPAGHGQHLRHPLRAPDGRPALWLRPQIHLQPCRL